MPIDSSELKANDKPAVPFAHQHIGTSVHYILQNHIIMRLPSLNHPSTFTVKKYAIPGTRNTGSKG